MTYVLRFLSYGFGYGLWLQAEVCEGAKVKIAPPVQHWLHTYKFEEKILCLFTSALWEKVDFCNSRQIYFSQLYVTLKTF